MPFEWTRQAEDAAQLLADGRLTNSEIAEKLGIDRKTLYNWRQAPEFSARVDALFRSYQDETERLGLSQRVNRLRNLNDLWTRMRRVIEARADAPEMADVPGGSTGLLCKSTKGLGSGDNFKTIDEFEIDAALLKEIREYQKAAAIERGEWSERHEIDLRKLSDAEIIARAASLLGGIAPAGADASGDGPAAVEAVPE